MIKGTLVCLAISASLSVQAQDFDHSEGGVVQQSAPATPSIYDADYHGFSVTPSQVNQARCRVTVPASDAEFKQWLDVTVNTSPGPLVTKTIHGVTLRDQPPELLALFDSMITTRGLPETQAALSVPASCTNFTCAVTALFGESQAMRITYLMKKYGINSSPLAGFVPRKTDAGGPASTAALSSEELDDVIRGVADMPASALSRYKNIGIFRRTDSFASGSPSYLPGSAKSVAFTHIVLSDGQASASDSDVNLLDVWMGLDRGHRQSTVFHELTHFFASSNDRVDERAPWRIAAGWAVVGGGYVKLPEAAKVSRYGATSIDEDYAESAVAYRYNPEALKRAGAAKYDFIRQNMFGGVEYTSGTNCP